MPRRCGAWRPTSGSTWPRSPPKWKPAVADIIRANHELASLLDINGTPTFVIRETMVRGYVPLDGMRQIVQGQRAAK
jgi:protein-disulfide isomerase